MWAWSAYRKNPDPLAAEPIYTRLLAEWDHPPLFVRLVDERGYPAWLRPPPSLRLLQRPPDPSPLRIRYGPGVAERLTASSPARHLREYVLSDEDEAWWPPA